MEFYQPQPNEKVRFVEDNRAQPPQQMMVLDEAEMLFPKANRATRRACAKQGHMAKRFPDDKFRCWQCGEELS